MDIEPDDFRLALRRFRCESVRSSEESFARLLTEQPAVSLGFVDDGSYTDGKRIFLDPSMCDAYRYRAGLMEAEASIGADEGYFSDHPTRALHMITRALNIHECLHIIYTRFPIISSREKRAQRVNGRKVLSTILNIIEDYYIEMAGCSVYDNMSTYLRFLRTAIGFASLRETDGAHHRNPRVLSFLNHMIHCILYPMVPVGKPPGWMVPYIESTKGLFNEGCTSHDPDTRYQCACRIFDEIQDLIPSNMISDEVMERNLCNGTDPGTGTSDRFSSGSKDMPEGPAPLEPLDGDGNPATEDRFSGFDEDLESVERECQGSEDLIALHEEMNTPHTCVIPSSDYPGPHCHDGIGVRETVLETIPGSMSRYAALRRRVSLRIGSLDRRLKSALSAEDHLDERRLIIGSSLDSRRLFDPRGRIWKRRVVEDAVLDLAVMLLIDGSGSMGQRRDSTIEACICIHEVLAVNGITHAIAEHRAESYDEIQVDVLRDFHGNPLQKTNIMRYQCRGVNRDGLALLWAESRLMRDCEDSDAKLIVIVSDGLPNHQHSGILYSGESARKDISGIVRRMQRSGVDVVAVSLVDDDPEMRTNLDAMYDNVISFGDVSQLPRRLVDILVKLLSTRRS